MLIGRTGLEEFIPSGSPVGWWPADKITGLEDGDPVGTWVDWSGNSNDLTQSISTNKPVYKTHIQNGKPIVRSVSTDWVLRSALGSTLSQPNTIFLVAKATVNTSWHYYCSNGVSDGHMIYYHSTAHDLVIWAGTELKSGDVTYNSFLMLTALFNGASSDLRKNGSSIANGNAGSNSLVGFSLLARFDGQNPITGDMAEAILYDGNESPYSNESMLNAKYDLYWEPSGSPIGWWPADGIKGLENDDPVGTWPDQSGNGYDVVQSTAAQKPVYKTNVQNGLPAVLFVTVGYDRMFAENVGISYSNEYFTVHSANTCIAASGHRPAYFGMSSDKDTQSIYYMGFQMYRDQTPDWSPYIWIGDGVSYEGDKISENHDNNSHLITIRRDGTGVNISGWKDNVSKSLGGANLTKTASADSFFMSSRYDTNTANWQGYIFETIYYDTALSPGNRSSNDVGLMNKWGI